MQLFARFRTPLAALVLSALVACSSATSGPRTDRGGSTNRDILTNAEMQETRLASAFEVVQRLRPNWLRMRNVPTSNRGEPLEIVVYLDNVRYGGTSALRGMSTVNLERMQWIDGPSATQRWGTGHAAGAILITTRGSS